MDEAVFDEDDEPDWIEPDFSRRKFLKWRSPRFGGANPDRMTNPVWTWLVLTRLNAYRANQHFKGPDPFTKGPCWCADRFGQSTTELSDGRNVLIGGEHEDYYDPDFQIYNDVIVRGPNDEIEIFGYPAADFPPTDFHSATLLDDGRIIVIGNLGYPEGRHPGETPIFRLDTDSWRLSRTATEGDSPGWIHRHSATLNPGGDSIDITGGIMVKDDEVGTLLENIDDWRLDLATWTWRRLTEKPWEQWEFVREDGESSDIWSMRHTIEMADLDIRLPKIEGMEEFEGELESVFQPPRDPDLLEQLYRPPCDFDPIPEGDPEDFNSFRISIEGVILRFVEDMDTVQLTVEGELPESTVKTVVEDVKEKLEKLERAPYLTKRHR